MNRESTQVFAERLLPLFFCVFVFFITFVKLWDSDTFWHLKAGEVIAHSDSLPRTDVFSHTKYGEEWINDEWLGDYYLYSVFNKHNYAGVQIIVCLATLMTMFVVFQTCVVAGANPLLVYPFLAAGLIAARARFTARPEIFSTLFLCGVFFLLTSALQKQTNNSSGKSVKRKGVFSPVFLIPVILAIWTNFHPGSPFGLFLIFCAIASFIASASFHMIDYDAAMITTRNELVVILGLSILATALNPYGTRALAAPLHFASSGVYLKHIAEWAPLPIKDMFSLKGFPANAGIPFFAIAGIVSAIILRKRVNLFHLVVFCAVAFMAFKSRRFIVFIALLSQPVISVAATVCFQKVLDKKWFRSLIAGALLAFFVVASYFVGYKNQVFLWGKGINLKSYPSSAIDFFKRTRLDGNMFNTYDIGGPLIWGLHPDQKVFVDGRTTFYGPEFYSMIMIFEMNPDTGSWEKLQKAFDITYAVLKSDRTAVAAAILKSSGDWRLVFWDDQAMVLAKSAPLNNKLISKYSYRFVTPTNAMSVARDWNKLDPAIKEVALAELERNASESTTSLQAILSLSYIYFIEKRYDNAIDMAEKGLALSPRQSRLHAMIGDILMKRGDAAGAEERYRKAAEISKEFRSNLQNSENANE